MNYDFPCGCSIPIIDEAIKPEDGLPSMEIDFLNIRHDCPLAWSVFTQGKTKGVFQLEKNLGKSWSANIQPVSIEELAALISLIRPGSLKAFVDGKNMTTHFADRKRGDKEYENFHELADPILDSTYGIIAYQEQTLALAKIFAGFDLVQADILRKAIGKKKADVMAQMRSVFIDGCEKAGIINVEEAVALFDIIEKSNRYSFNKAHAVGYAETGYWCAYAKAHFPLHFFCSWLAMSGEKMRPREEIAELVLDSKDFNVEIVSPSILTSQKNFSIKDGKVQFGLGNIKGIGSSNVLKAIAGIAKAENRLGKPIKDFSWPEILFYLTPELTKPVVMNLIAVGAISHFNMSRKETLFEFQKFKSLKGSEVKFIQEQGFKSLPEALDGLLLGKKLKAPRQTDIADLLKIVKNPPETLKDSIQYISGIETELMGTSLTCSKLDDCDISAVNCTCAAFPTTTNKSIVVGVQIDRVTEWRPPGKSEAFAFITAHDNTGSIEVTVQPQDYAANNFALFVGNTVLFTGFKNKKGKFTAKGITQI